MTRKSFYEIVERMRAALGATVALGLAAAAPGGALAADDGGARERERMVLEIAGMARDTGGETGRPRFADRVMDAMRRVPRHRLVPSASLATAYENRPLPIGSGQTISQPYIVALSTDLLDVRPGDRVLEIGTGSGYQAAVLAELVRDVYSIEIVEPLGRQALERLAALGYKNIHVKIGDGYRGWPEHAPFDRIVVTAAAPYVPDALIEQLARNGRMVIPVGRGSWSQQLMLITKDADGTIGRKNVLSVRFVPLTGPGVEGKRDKP
ncbi:MAG TPA: protein-L-isoaspartate(D-aspartate) O-methyltransferase [Casimicrobiaceae bacterium]|nr:protein-L-isoaspartate(D-aspartate) O-methyltransferase [Casimicrobiaceae bacterium]